MRGAVLPVALLCLAFVFMVTFAPDRARVAGIIAAIGTTAGALLIGAITPWPPRWHEGAFLTAWASVIVMSGSVHLPRTSPVWTALVLVSGAVAGFSIAAVVAYEGQVGDLVWALPVLLLYPVARFIVDRGWGIAVKVVASWLIALR